MQYNYFIICSFEYVKGLIINMKISDVITLAGVLLALIVYIDNIKHNRRQLTISKLEELFTILSDLLKLYEPLREGYSIVIAQYNGTLIQQVLVPQSEPVLRQQSNIAEIAGSKELLYSMLSRIEILNNAYVTNKNLKEKIETIAELYSTFALTIFCEARDNSINFPIPSEKEYLYLYEGLKEDILKAMKLKSTIIKKEDLDKYKKNNFQKDFTIKE